MRCFSSCIHISSHTFHLYMVETFPLLLTILQPWGEATTSSKRGLTLDQPVQALGFLPATRLMPGLDAPSSCAKLQPCLEIGGLV